MKKTTKNPRSGQLFDDFLKEQGLYEECSAAAVKSVLSLQLLYEMKQRHMTKAALAKKMNTSRSQIDRLLDPDMTGISIDTLQRAAEAVGRHLHVALV